MASCNSCGVSVPSCQATCSMCYGDIDHGRDGYYRAWAEEQDRRAAEDAAEDAVIEAAVFAAAEAETPDE